ncbi:hypothetical protein D3C80_2200850 [compost metagenome]
MRQMLQQCRYHGVAVLAVDPPGAPQLFVIAADGDKGIQRPLDQVGAGKAVDVF